MKCKEYETKSGKPIRLWLGNCMELMMRELENRWHLAIVDPPYGIDVTKMNMGSRKTVEPDERDWDVEAPDIEYFNELERVSENQIIWGGNYYEHLDIYNPKAKRVHEFKKLDGIVWDKGATMYGRDFSECEIAYSTIGNEWYKTSPVQLDRIHHAQKPPWLYRNILSDFATAGDTILDTHGGSMSLAIACYMEDFELDIIELDEDYYTAAVQRFEQHISQTTLF